MERINKFNKGDVVLITSYDNERGKTGVVNDVIQVGLCYDYKVIPSECLHIKPDSAVKVECTVHEEDLVLINKSQSVRSLDPINIIKCAKCGSNNISVIDTDKDLLKDHGVIYRRKKCMDCNYRFTTFEIHSEDYRRMFPADRNK